MLMRRYAVMAAALLALGGCKSSSGPDNVEPIVAEEYIGEWTMLVVAAANCWPQFEIKFDITIAHVDAFRGQTTFTFTDPAGWWRESDPAHRYPLEVTVNGATRTAVVRPGMGSPVVQAAFASDGLNKDIMGGFFSDPEGVFRTQAGTRPCEAQARITREA